MEESIIKIAMTQGIWAVLAVFLIIYIIKAQEKRDKEQEKREESYQQLIKSLFATSNVIVEVNENVKYIIEKMGK